MDRKEHVREAREWLRKGDDGLYAAKVLLEKNAKPWIIAFHAQQAAEKYLKAFLVYNQKRFRKTHDISELLELCMEIDEDFARLQELEVDKLTDYAVEFRYPGIYEASEDEAREAVKLAEETGRFVRNKLSRT